MNNERLTAEAFPIIDIYIFSGILFVRQVLFLFLLILSQYVSAQLSIHVEEAEKHRETGYLNDKDYDLLNGFLLMDRKVEIKGELQKIVFGYHPYWGGSNYLNYQWELLSDLCYFSYEVDPETGNPLSYYGWLTSPAIDSAFAHDVRVHLCVTLFSGHSTFFGNQQSQLNLTNNLLSLLMQRGATGISFDFEAVPASQGNNMLDYIAGFSVAFRQNFPDGILSIAMPAVDWSGIFDPDVLNEYIDLYMIMGYDYYWNGSSQAGPVDPHYSMTNTYNYSVSRTISHYQSAGMPLSKMLLGVPYYAREWPTASGSAPSATTGHGTAYTWAKIQNNASGHYSTANKKLEPNSFGPYFAYNDGGWHQCFVNDPGSLSRRYKLVNRRGLAGIGIWALGYDNGYPDLWQLIAGNFSQGTGLTFPDTLYDSGGPAWNYYDNEHYTLELRGMENEFLNISFSQFSLETGYDSLWIYDGTYPGGNLVGGFTGNTLPPILSGSNRMTLRFKSDHNTSVSGWMALVQNIPVTVMEVSPEYDITVYPNPTSGILYIDGSKAKPIIRFYDMKGSLIRSYAEDTFPIRLDLTDYSPGIYFFSVECGNKHSRHKIVKF